MQPEILVWSTPGEKPTEGSYPSFSMETKTQVRTFLTTNFYIPDGAVPADDASLLDQGIIDSTGILEVIEYLEDTFGITVEDAEMLPDNLDSVNRIAAFVERKQA